MPKTVIEFLEEGRKALMADTSEIPDRIEDADASNALAAGKLIDEQVASMPERKVARLFAYACVIARLKEEAAKPTQASATSTATTGAAQAKK